MGLYGNIVIYPTDAVPLMPPHECVQAILRLFVEHGLLKQAAEKCAPESGRASATFEAYVERSAPTAAQYAYVLVPPELLTKKLKELVYVLDVDTDGNPAPIELPFLEVSAFSELVPLDDTMAGSGVPEVAAAVEFSYEDARLSDDLHRVRDETHPVLSALSRLLGAPMGWTVIAG